MNFNALNGCINFKLRQVKRDKAYQDVDDEGRVGRVTDASASSGRVIECVAGVAVGPLVLWLAEAGAGAVIPVVAAFQTGRALVHVLALTLALLFDVPVDEFVH